jgi:hypothetical protein
MPNVLTRKLPCQLTGDEEIQKSQEIARAIEDLSKRRDQKKAAASMYRSQMDEVEAKLAELSHEIATHTTERAVDCMVKPDWRSGKVDLIRVDTGEVVESKVMTSAERQKNFAEDDSTLSKIFGGADIPDGRSAAAGERPEPNDQTDAGGSV